MNSQQIAAFFSSCPAGGAYGNAQAAPAFGAVNMAQSTVQFVGVTGHAGKTTVCGMVTGILQQAGFTCGCYTVGAAPLKERIRVDGKPVQVAVLSKPAAALQKLPAPPPCTVAELAAACACFSAAGCQFAVVELPDASLAAFLPRLPVGVITLIGDDGSGFAPERLAQSAAALMRKGSVVVTAPNQPKAVLSELVVAAAQKGCGLKVPEIDDLTYSGKKLRGSCDYGGYEFLLPQPGCAAAENAAVAVETALELWKKGVEIEDEAILAGVPLVGAESGLHYLRHRPRILADPCHKPLQAAALARSLASAGLGKVSVIAGLTDCMDPEAFFAALEGGFVPDDEQNDKKRMAGMSDNPVQMVYCVTPEGEDAVPADETEQQARFHFDTEICDSLQQALEMAQEDEPDALVVLGGEAVCRAAAALFQ
ncbi:MAG: folylpolyglutamate synthase [Faecalibacterium sp.]|nr:folylpolyglutamate synthase [Faecalibacterium sp.]